MYVVVAVLSITGDQVPVIPFVDVVGNGARAFPEQIAGTALKVGVAVALVLMVTVSVICEPQALVAVSVKTILPDAEAAKV